LKTEQAHSPPAAGQGSRALSTKAGSAVWLNLACLDAPIVAVAWLWLFARTFRVPVHLGNAVALFLTAWLIYLADRFADASSLRAGSPRSLRQEFCLEHREIWISALLLIAGFDLYVIWRSLAMGTFFAGALVGILALTYLALNHPHGLLWRSLPAKEITIGSLFTGGTLVALFPAFPAATMLFVTCALAFAALCSLNCISIACWERQLDQMQGKISIATRHPGFAGLTRKLCVGLALASLTMAIFHGPAAPIFACIGASALLLALLDTLPRRDGDDQRTALADLVLLTPIIPLMVAMAS
jgi:hypothetical protein